MKSPSGNLRTCNKGHRYLKSSDCPVCPVCERDRKPKTGFLSGLSAPARRALEAKGIKTLEQLTAFKPIEIALWHGIGPKTIRQLEKTLNDENLIKKENDSTPSV